MLNQDFYTRQKYTAVIFRLCLTSLLQLNLILTVTVPVTVVLHAADVCLVAVRNI